MRIENNSSLSDDTIDLLDFVYFIARIWPALLLFPAFVFGVVYLYVASMSTSYVASVRIEMPVFVPDTIVEGVLPKVSQIQTGEGVDLTMQSRIINIKSESVSPSVAQSAVIQERAEVIKVLNESCDFYEDLIDLQREFVDDLSNGKSRDAETINAIVALTENVHNQTSILNASRFWVEGVNEEPVGVVSAGRPGVVGVAAASLAGLLVFVVALLRSAVRSLKRSPDSKAKIDLIWKALLLRRL